MVYESGVDITSNIPPFLDIASDFSPDFPRKSEGRGQTQMVDQDMANHEPRLRIQTLDRCRSRRAGPEQITRSWAAKNVGRKNTEIFHGNFMEEMWDHEGTCKKIGGRS